MKKDRIERLLFWFKDGGEEIVKFNNHFFGLAILLDRLINEAYTGKKIKFVNIDFASEAKYKAFPQIPKNFIHYYEKGGGHLRFYGELDFIKFDMLRNEDQKLYIWEKAHTYLQLSANKINNKNLLAAVEYAYSKGINLKLNTDFKVIESKALLHNKLVSLSIYIVFKDNKMISKLVLKNEELVLLDKKIDEVESANEFFLEIYKSVEIIGDNILIKGHKDIEYLPLRIPIDSSIFTSLR